MVALKVLIVPHRPFEDSIARLRLQGNLVDHDRLGPISEADCPVDDVVEALLKAQHVLVSHHLLGGVNLLQAELGAQVKVPFQEGVDLSHELTRCLAHNPTGQWQAFSDHAHAPVRQDVRVSAAPAFWDFPKEADTTIR